MEAELCSARTLSPSREESGDEELSVLPRHTKVIVTGNNRTKSVLVGLQGVVKKAVGLGGWHWLVLKNGVEVKLQRNALSVLEAPTGNEDDDDDEDIDCNNSFCSSSDVGDKDIDYRKLSQFTNHYEQRVNLAKLGTPTLLRYWRRFNLVCFVGINPKPTKEQLLHVVQNHFLSQSYPLAVNKKKKQVDEMQVIVGFIHAAKRLKSHHRKKKEQGGLRQD
ncbi:hypothetical protein BHM03_00001579 [Ensete ventricosum]|nr:hypothetical protein BHM03_00001579 [Ensete ventricosum]